MWPGMPGRESLLDQREGSAVGKALQGRNWRGARATEGQLVVQEAWQRRVGAGTCVAGCRAASGLHGRGLKA